MARVAGEPRVGQRVYRFGKPLRPGIIQEVYGLSANSVSFKDVKVKWLDGVVEVRTSNGLQDFDALIEDHRRKLETHLKTLKKLESL